ncbi:oligosaccharide flippase family protein [Novosphingobium flavum]|uniref:oligosaccharide flippase family protein n=1 Tax=Novosphingobium aerophilum TaxID=2839843 RepID=UPI001639EC30|nr:oligosaccharide flippase family protein [Novosphingobium aerophilum]MBC2662457.1 oligosaccharide flippase family protein [Novosphingobium aerophilum]
MTIVRQGSLLFASQIADSALTLGRNLLLARLLSVEQFGIAASFSILMMLIDVTQGAGLDRMLVQAKSGELDKTQATLQTAQLVMGIGSGLIILAISWPYSVVMGTHGMVAAYLIFSMLPVLRSLQNLDMYRLQRENKFWPMIIRSLSAQVVSLASIWPLHWWFGDYRTAIGSILIFHTAAFVASHLGAERPIRFAADPEVLARAKRFGAPILLNGVFLFFVMNGDRMVVSNRFGPAMLGAFSAAALLAMSPTLVMSRVVQTLFLPRMSRAQDDQVRLQWLFNGAGDGTILLAVCFTLGTALMGVPLLLFLFGPKYAVAAPYLLLLVVMQSIRFVRAVPAVVAMARAETRNPLYANIVRGAFVPLAFLAAVFSQDIFWLILTGIMGEVVAAFSSTYFVRRMIGLDLRHFLWTLTAGLGVMASLLANSLFGLAWGYCLIPLAVFMLQVRGLGTVMRSGRLSA